jgi:hypothetical protein
MFFEPFHSNLELYYMKCKRSLIAMSVSLRCAYRTILTNSIECLAIDIVFISCNTLTMQVAMINLHCVTQFNLKGETL